MRGKKTSDEKKEQVKAVIYLNPTVSHKDIAKITKLPESTVRGIREEIKDTDEFNEARQLKKQEFIAKAFELAMETLNVIAMKVLSLKECPEQLFKANVRDLTTALGTLYDKQALASGEPTQISESRKAIPDLIKDLEAETAKLKQMVAK
jgi:hypothetical protein